MSFLRSEVPMNLSESTNLIVGIHSASRRIARSMKNDERPEELHGKMIRAVHDKVGLMIANLCEGRDLLAELAIEKYIRANIFRLEGKDDFANAAVEVRKKRHTEKLETLTLQVENLRRIIGLDLSPYHFDRHTEIFPDGWAMLVRARGGLAGFPFEGNGTIYVRKDSESLNERFDELLSPYRGLQPRQIEISLAHLSHPYPDSPETVIARTLPLAIVDEKGVTLSTLKPRQKPSIVKIYNAQNVITTIYPPRFHQPLSYRRI